MKHKLYNRLLSLALALGLVVGMLPGMTFAGAVDSDATALQSQVEQIAEPTEEPETVSEESSQAEATPTPAPESSEEESSQVEETPAPTEEPVQEPENNEDTESAFIPPVNYTNVAPLEEENSPALPAMNTMNLLSVGRENEDTTDNGLELAKAVTGNRDDGYQVKLEAYTTGTVTSTTSTKPADIVLVLDVSGSMDYCLECGNSEGYNHKWNYGHSFVNRMDALRTAVSAFLESVQESAAGKDGRLGTDDDVDHRVSFVKFAGKNNENVGNDTYEEWVSIFQRATYNFSQQVTDLLDMTISSSATTIMNELNRINPAGATQADYGMRHAADILESARQEEGYDRSQVAILFTDGQPTSGSSFEDDVANDAISEAHRIKGAGGTVYTIGVFSGADGTVPANADALENYGVSEENRYMHLVSSNFPDATGWEHHNGWNQQDQWGELNPNLEGNDSYYLSANNTDDLTDIFESISGEISSPAVTLGTGTVIRDVVTDYFELPQSGQVTVQKYDKTLNSDNSIDWVLDQGWSLNRNNITVDTNNDAVNVTGIDLSKYFVSENPRENPDNASDDKYYGSKFVITFPIEVKDTFFGGNQVPTNEVEQSGVIRENETNVFEEFPDPGKQDVALKYQFNVQDQTIYVSESANLSELIEYVVGYVPGTILPSEDTEKNNDYVDLVFTVRDAANIVVGTYTVAAKSSEGSWTWADGYTGDYAKFKDCTDFTISCTVQPKPEGSIGPMDVSSVNNPATVHVLKPTVTWKDTTKEANTNITADLMKTENYVSVEWSDKTPASEKHTPSSEEDANIEDRPILSYTFETVDNENFPIPLTNELHVAVNTVKANGVDITSDTSFAWTTNTEGSSGCTEACNNPNPSYQFRIHVGNGDLTIIKRISGDAGSYDNAVFDFKIEAENGMVYYIHLDASSGEAQDTINLPSGTYTVTELDNLNYTPVGEKVKKVTVGGEDATVTFTNNSTPTKIPSDSGATQNIPKWNSNNLVGWKPDDNIKDGNVQTDETSN